MRSPLEGLLRRNDAGAERRRQAEGYVRSCPISLVQSVRNSAQQPAGSLGGLGLKAWREGHMQSRGGRRATLELYALREGVTPAQGVGHNCRILRNDMQGPVDRCMLGDM